MRLVLLWLLAFAGGAGAAEITDLYRAEVVVSSRDEAARTQDFRRALNRALARLVPPDRLSAALQATSEQADRYVLGFEYRDRPVAEGGGSLLRVEFDPERLQSALHTRQIPVWGRQRPELMVWIALRDESGLRLAGADQTPEVDRLLRTVAEGMGLPLALPLGDLADRQALSPADVESADAERIRLASARYEADAILGGTVVRTAEDRFETEWRLYRTDGADRWTGRFPRLADALRAGLEDANGRLAGRLVPPGARRARVQLRVTGVTSLDAADRAARYLTGLAPVDRLEWLEIGTGNVTFRLDVRGGSATLREALALGGALRPAAEAEGAEGLTYHWSR